MNEERGHWYLLTGLVIGLIIGLAFAWLIYPVEYVDTSPASLRKDFKEQYRTLIAAAYVANQDLVRAKARLDLLGDQDVYQALAEQAQRKLAEGSSSSDARALGLLAIALGQGGLGPGMALTPTPTRQITDIASSTPLPATPTETYTPSPTSTLPPSPPADETHASELEASPSFTPSSQGTPSATPIRPPSFTPTASRTSTSTPGGPFVLLSREKICDQKLPAPLIQVIALNAQGQQVPGVLVIVTWGINEERFFTGLKPEKGLGYADFTLQSGVVYSLRLGEAGVPVLDLMAVECQGANGERYWGAWLLKFVQP